MKLAKDILLEKLCNKPNVIVKSIWPNFKLLKKKMNDYIRAPKNCQTIPRTWRI